MRKAITLVEVLALICIVGVLAMLLVPAVMQVTTGDNNSQTEIFQCVKTYVLNRGDYSPEFKVNLKKLNSQEVIVFKTEESIFAQFQPEKYYEVDHYVFLGVNYIRSARFVEKTIAENGESF